MDVDGEDTLGRNGEKGKCKGGERLRKGIGLSHDVY